MNQPQQVSVLIAFTAGLFSFFSPCVLPLVPSYITYITGVSFRELSDLEARRKARVRTILHSVLFIGGFSLIFILMGASASYLGQLLSKYQSWIMKIGGILIILLGLQFVLQLFPFLQIEKRIHFEKKSLSYLGSFVVGIVFAAGWTPCIGPILSTILIYASTSKNLTTGVILLTFYSLGLGIPFFIAALAFNTFLSAFEKLRRYMRTIVVVSGLFLIAIGVLILTGSLSSLSNYLVDFFEEL